MNVTEDPEILKTFFEYHYGFVTSKIMFTACELGVFDLLLESGEPLSLATIAERLGTSHTGMEKLLQACVGLKLLKMEKKDNEDLYGNSNLANLFLAKSSLKSQYHHLKFHSELFYSDMQRMPDTVREGKGQFEKTDDSYNSFYRSEEDMQRFSDAMDDAWKLFGREVMSAFDLSNFPLICDLGGGSGALAKECISLYPNSSVIIFDLPQVVERAKKPFLSSDKCKITFQEGDFLKDPLPDADLYILARILHNRNDEECLELLTKVHKACKPGGGVLVVEMLLHEDKCGPVEALIYSMLMMIFTQGRERTSSEYKSLFTAAGFKEIQVKEGTKYALIQAPSGSHERSPHDSEL